MNNLEKFKGELCNKRNRYMSLENIYHMNIMIQKKIIERTQKDKFNIPLHIKSPETVAPVRHLLPTKSLWLLSGATVLFRYSVGS